jgi:hypothetical protein
VQTAKYPAAHKQLPWLTRSLLSQGEMMSLMLPFRSPSPNCPTAKRSIGFGIPTAQMLQICPNYTIQGELALRPTRAFFPFPISTEAHPPVVHQFTIRRGKSGRIPIPCRSLATSHKISNIEHPPPIYFSQPTPLSNALTGVLSSHQKRCEQLGLCTSTASPVAFEQIQSWCRPLPVHGTALTPIVTQHPVPRCG